MRKLEGKIALVTGANSGIGLATAKRFVSEGAYVFITGRRDAELAAAAAQIERNVTAVPGDVSRPADLDRLFAQIKREKGRLDVLFANAGVAKYAPLGTITEEFYDSIFDINVKGLLFTVQKALPLMPDGASIILNASIVGGVAVGLDGKKPHEVALPVRGGPPRPCDAKGIDRVNALRRLDARYLLPLQSLVPVELVPSKLPEL